MNCAKCGQKVAEESEYCVRCGEPLFPKGSRAEEERRERWEGSIQKCPNCGAHLGAFTAFCPECGHEIRNAGAESRVNELARRLSEMESAEKRDELIRSFYIPNTREEIIEFTILASSNIKIGSYEVDAWSAKLEQAYQKASLAFGDTQEFARVQRLYNETMKKQSVIGIFWTIRKSWALQAGIIALVGLLMDLIGSFAARESGDPNSPFYTLSMSGFMLMWVGGLMALLNFTKKDTNKKSKTKK